MTQVSVLTFLPDGSAIGLDANGTAYKGTPRDVPPDQLGVWTIDATGELGEEAFHRITHDGATIVGWGTTTRKAYAAAHRSAIAGTLPEDADDSEVDAAVEVAWQAEKGTTGHRPQPEFGYRVFDWTEV